MKYVGSLLQFLKRKDNLLMICCHQNIYAQFNTIYHRNSVHVHVSNDPPILAPPESNVNFQSLHAKGNPKAKIPRKYNDPPKVTNQSINHGGLSRAAHLARQSSWLVIQTSSSNLSSVPKSLFRVSMKVALGRPRPLRP